MPSNTGQSVAPDAMGERILQRCHGGRGVSRREIGDGVAERAAHNEVSPLDVLNIEPLAQYLIPDDCCA